MDDAAMIKTTLIAALLALATEASARSRSYYDASGRRIGSATTDSQGTVTTHDARGRVVTRESTSGTVTTVYDARGRNIGRFTTGR
jgi:YD repeat-containing protein